MSSTQTLFHSLKGEMEMTLVCGQLKVKGNYFY